MLQVADSSVVTGSPPDYWIAWVDLIVSVCTVFAIGIGGWWTYKLFRQKRQRYPRANISHSINLWDVENCKRLLRVGIRIENVGDVLLRPSKGHVRLQLVRPWPYQVRDAANDKQPLVRPGSREANWPKLGENTWEDQSLEIEPNEVDIIYLDFIVPQKVETVKVYSHLVNPLKQGRFSLGSKDQIGWTTSSIHELGNTDMNDDPRDRRRSEEDSVDYSERDYQKDKVADESSGPEDSPLGQSNPETEPDHDDIVDEL